MRKLFDGFLPILQDCHVGLTVWVDSWQMQCCGEPFRVGSQVTWTLGAADQDWLRETGSAGLLAAGTRLPLFPVRIEPDSPRRGDDYRPAYPSVRVSGCAACR